MHHYFHPNQLYLTLDTLLKAKKRLQNIELPKGVYPDYPTFVDSTVFNRKSNNSLSIYWKVKSISGIIRRKEITKNIQSDEDINSYKDLCGFFVKYLKSLEDIKVNNIDNIPLIITLINSPKWTDKLQQILNEYIKLFVDDELFGTGKDISFNAHLEIFREYLSRALKVFNPKYLLISPSDLTNRLQEKYTIVNEYQSEYKFIEMVTTLWLADIIDIYYLEIKSINNKLNYNVTLTLKNYNHLTNDYIRDRFRLKNTSKSMSIPPMDRSYSYENSQLIFRLSDGSTDQFDFSKANVSRKLFETFWTLWKADIEKQGEYQEGDICKMYKKLHKEDILSGKLGEIISNIRSTIIEPKTMIKDRIEWRYDRKRGNWLFKLKD